jgi:hypothetical protein
MLLYAHKKIREYEWIRNPMLYPFELRALVRYNLLEFPEVG